MLLRFFYCQKNSIAEKKMDEKRKEGEKRRKLVLAIKKKHLNRREWYEEFERDFSCMYQKDEFFEGGIGLITFTDMKEPSEVNTGDGKLCIAARGYQWLEFVPKGGHCALTAMFYPFFRRKPRPT